MAVSRAERTRLKNARTVARRSLIIRTARTWSRLYKEITADLGDIVQKWLESVERQAQRDIASGDILNPPDMPEKFTETLQGKLREAMAYGYWLNHLYVQEIKAAYQGRKYHGKVNLSDLSDDEELRELLQDFISEGSEWHEIIPVEAVNWLNNYVPKLANVLDTAVLERTRDVIRNSLLEGSTLRERMKALRESSEELANMARQRIEAIARTEVTRADSMGRLISMKANDDVIGVEFSAVMDDRTTDMCVERNGLIMRLDDPRLPENTPPLHINCVLGDTLVLPIGSVSAASERVFNGDIFIIESAGGNYLAGTPNHPILTCRGWIPLCEVKEGDYIVCNALRERGDVINGKNQQMIARIEDATSAFLDNSKVRATPVPMTAEDFHHDGGQSDVAVIYTDRELLDRVKSSIDEHIVKNGFGRRSVIRSFFEHCKCAFFFFRNSHFSASNGFMSFLGKFQSFFRRNVLHSYELLFMPIARLHAMFNKNAFDRIGSCDIKADSNTPNTYTLIMQSDDSFMVDGIDGTFPLNATFEQNIIHLIERGMIFFAKFTESETCKIVFDKVINVKRDRFNGHVYNLQTKSGIFVANNIITHNCRSLLLSLTIYDFPDGVLTSHEFDEVPAGMQRPEDIAEVSALLEKEREEEKVEPQSVMTIPTAKTIAEANTIAVQYGLAKEADFGKLHISVANEMIEQLRMRREMFPELPELDFVGSMQAQQKFRVRVIKDEYFEAHKEALRRSYPRYTDEQIKEKMLSIKKHSTKGAYGGAYRGNGEDGESYHIRSVGLNETFFSRKGISDGIHERLRFEEEIHWRPQGTGSVKGTITHELGHTIDNSLGISSDNQICTLFADYNKKYRDIEIQADGTWLYVSPMAKELSEYGNTNINEFIAEAWSEYMTSSAPRPIAKKVSERIIELYQEAVK